ncbi:hypothetical protein K8374_13100 [Pseudomonas sp. p1(2021b)]|uniref:hypothetical protein n=1 Tax=Pseudomonas TaxID=286 RepID=UPI0015DC6A0A|nr:MULTISPECIES: hypothetical protein [Pseudomonas]UBM23341.1 hypothetical protein K8374_13100 [Pseudomonas sp. p1(2021b)]BBR53486.1 hypothetical protein WP4W18C03_18130 [Pseudomonas putida]
MNKKTRQDVVDFIESRFEWARERFTDVLRAELDTAIDLAGLVGAIDLPEQRHYKERLNRFVMADHEQWMTTNGRVA